MSRTCSDCSSPITRQSKTGRCRTCASLHNHRNPEFRARLEAASAAGKRTAASRAKARASAIRREIERKDDPVWRAFRVAGGLRMRAAYEASPDAQARSLAKRAAVGEKITNKRLGWLPVHLRPQYHTLRKQVGASEAKRMTLAEMTPFERQLARIAGGAQLIAAPDFRTPDPAFTLGGVSSAAL